MSDLTTIAAYVPAPYADAVEQRVEDVAARVRGPDGTLRAPEGSPPGPGDGDARALLSELAPPRYVAIMGYLPYSDATENAVAQLRVKPVERFGDEPAGDLDTPGEPYSFATLIRAQADGDLQTLRGHGLDAARVPVEHTDQIKELL